MKYSFSILLFLVSLNMLNAQILDNYKYVTVLPTEFAGGSHDPYNIENRISIILQEKGMIFLDNTEKDKWPLEAVNNPQKIAFISILATKKPNAWNCGIVKVSIQDYSNKQFVNKSIKSRQSVCWSPYLCCYEKWGDAVTKYLGSINYTQHFKETVKYEQQRNEKIIVEITNETENSLKNYFENNNLSDIEGIYRSIQSVIEGNYTLGIKKYGDEFKAIVIASKVSNWKQGEVKAIIKSSSMSNVFFVSWFMDNKEPYETIGSLVDSGLLSIELKNMKSDKNINERFIKIYPKSGNNQ